MNIYEAKLLVVESELQQLNTLVEEAFHDTVGFVVLFHAANLDTDHVGLAEEGDQKHGPIVNLLEWNVIIA